jgi:imidazolonepropionase-like amidohydrolase
MKMRKLTIVVLILLGCSGSLLASSLRGQAQSESKGESLALVGAKIYPSPTDKPIVGGIVLVRNGKIVAVGDQRKVRIPKSTRTLDCSGLILVAGFWNSHVHFTESKWENANSLSAAQLARQIQEMLTRYGFTHVLDTGSFLENTLAIRRRIENGEVPGLSIRTAGMPFVPPNGTPFYVAPVKLPELSTPEEAAKLVRERIAAGADAIKLFAASPASLDEPPVVMPSPVAKAAVATAHALGKPVVAHPTNNAGINVVLESGIDILAHTTPDGGEPWSDELVKKLRSANVALVPTLKLWKWELERKGASSAVTERFLNTAVSQLRTYAQAGGEILFGTDVGYMSDYDPRDEYLLMAKAGMDFRQILAALTTAPAKRFGVSERTGRIAKGMDADLVLLGDDPANDVKAFSNVRFTFRQGKVIYDSKTP